MNTTTAPHLDKRILWGWIAIIVLAALVYTAGISHESLWYDEAYSAVIASYPPWQIPAQIRVDNHPPLHYETDLPELLATHQTFWYITCNTGASLPLWEVLQDTQGWERSGSRVIAAEPYSPIIFTAQKYARQE